MKTYTLAITKILIKIINKLHTIIELLKYIIKKVNTTRLQIIK